MAELVGLARGGELVSDWHGWSKHLGAHKGPALHIGNIPGRKRIALYEANGELRVLAWFNTEGDAKRCLALLDWLVEPAKQATP